MFLKSRRKALVAALSRKTTERRRGPSFGKRTFLNITRLAWARALDESLTFLYKESLQRQTRIGVSSVFARRVWGKGAYQNAPVLGRFFVFSFVLPHGSDHAFFGAHHIFQFFIESHEDRMVLGTKRI